VNGAARCAINPEMEEAVRSSAAAGLAILRVVALLLRKPDRRLIPVSSRRGELSTAISWSVPMPGSSRRMLDLSEDGNFRDAVRARDASS
jgi:hypothetical protein